MIGLPLNIFLSPNEIKEIPRKAGAMSFDLTFHLNRPEGPSAPSPGHRPGSDDMQSSPRKGKSKVNVSLCPYRAPMICAAASPGRCPGLRAIGLSGRFTDTSILIYASSLLFTLASFPTDIILMSHRNHRNTQKCWRNDI